MISQSGAYSTFLWTGAVSDLRQEQVPEPAARAFFRSSTTGSGPALPRRVLLDLGVEHLLGRVDVLLHERRRRASAVPGVLGNVQNPSSSPQVILSRSTWLQASSGHAVGRRPGLGKRLGTEALPCTLAPSRPARWGGDAEQVVGHVVSQSRSAIPSGQSGGNTPRRIRALGRDADDARSVPPSPRNTPGGMRQTMAVIGEIGERMAERAEFQSITARMRGSDRRSRCRSGSRRGRCASVACRDVGRAQAIRLSIASILSGLGRLILFRPACDLTGDVSAGPAEIPRPTATGSTLCSAITRLISSWCRARSGGARSGRGSHSTRPPTYSIR